MRTDHGRKHRCTACAAPFYDLHRSPIVCPKGGTTHVPVKWTGRTRVIPTPTGRDIEVAPEPHASATTEDGDARESGEDGARDDERESEDDTEAELDGDIDADAPDDETDEARATARSSRRGRAGSARSRRSRVPTREPHCPTMGVGAVRAP